MTLFERQVGDVTVLDVDGRVTIQEGSDALRDCFQQLADRGVSKVVVNCAKVPYLDTTGLSVILRAYLTAVRRGGSLKLLNLTPHVEQLFRVTKLLTVLEAFGDESAAVSSFKSATV